MNLEATYTFDATVERTWALLMDTEAIAACLPGCRGLRPAGDNRYEVDLGVAIAALSGDFKGTVALLDLVPPQSYTLAVEGTGRPGFVKGQARVTLEAAGERTLVKIAAQADVGGTIARLGQRLVEGVARTTMDRFYACLARREGRSSGSRQRSSSTKATRHTPVMYACSPVSNRQIWPPRKTEPPRHRGNGRSGFIIAVSTKPGCTSVTAIGSPLCRARSRRPSRYTD